jgi:hypothetical protein
MKQDSSVERMARLKKMVPRGKVTFVEPPPVKGVVLEPLTVRDLGLVEKRVA